MQRKNKLFISNKPFQTPDLPVGLYMDKQQYVAVNFYSW